ncbi:MAG: alanine racemase, partial [Spirochaetota bacterium]
MHTERGTYVTIDMNAIAHNISTVRSIIGPGGKILLPVKADAYGHGAVAVSRFVQEAGIVQYLGVASIEEGVELRENGIGLPILILGFIIP